MTVKTFTTSTLLMVLLRGGTDVERGMCQVGHGNQILQYQDFESTNSATAVRRVFLFVFSANRMPNRQFILFAISFNYYTYYTKYSVF